MTPPVVRAGLIGFGTVGAAFASELLARERFLASRLGCRLELARVAVRDVQRYRRAVPAVPYHGDASALAADPTLDIVVEVSGARDAGAWMRTALARGAAVVTANKQAVARDAHLLAELAQRDTRLFCEGAVAAAVPVVRALRDSLAAEEIHEIRGVLNGTSTFVLSRLEAGCTVAQAVADAQAAGFAEADPTDDLTGRDAAAKLAILATLAWRAPCLAGDVAVDGPAGAALLDVVRQAPPGTRIRQVASAWREDGRLRLRVAPAVLAGEDALARASGVTNVVQLRASLAGMLTWSGPGAGGVATASALLGDTLAAARTVVAERVRRAA